MTNPSPLYALTMTEAAAAIAAGRLTARALADAQLARIAATDAAIDAWETLDAALCAPARAPPTPRMARDRSPASASA